MYQKYGCVDDECVCLRHYLSVLVLDEQVQFCQMG